MVEDDMAKLAENIQRIDIDVRDEFGNILWCLLLKKNHGNANPTVFALKAVATFPSSTPSYIIRKFVIDCFSLKWWAILLTIILLLELVP